VLFGSFVVKTVYDDHQNLAAANQTLRSQTAKLVDPTSRDDQISDLKEQIGELTKGASPTPLRILIRYYGLEHETHVNDKTGQVFLVEGLTNQNISPIDVVLSCNQDFLPMNQPYLGVGGVYLNEELLIIDKRNIRVKLDSPAWTPETPLGMPIFTEAKDIGCQLKLDDRH
jgi:hypothetical protein